VAPAVHWIHRFSSPLLLAPALSAALLGLTCATALAEARPKQPQQSDAGGDPTLELRYVLDAIRIVGNTRTNSQVIERYIPFASGDILDVDDPRVEQTRYRLLGTGFFKDVTLSLERGARRGHVVLVVTLVERNTLVLNDLWMGVAASADTDGENQLTSTFAGIDAAETNLFGSGITLGSATAFSRDQWALSVRFFDPAFLANRWMLSSEILFNDGLGFFGNSDVHWDDPQQLTEVPRQAVVTYHRLGTTIGMGTDLSVASQLWFNYRLDTISAQLPFAAYHRYGGELEPIDFRLLPGRSLLSSVRATLVFDTRDEPLLTNTGWLARASGEISAPPLGSDYSFQRVDASGAHWWRMPNQHVVKLEGAVGLIVGNAPFFEQYYIGDLSDFRPGRVLGLAFDDRPAPNFLRTSISEIRYGDYSSRVNAEYRIPLYRGHRSVFGIDVFANLGVIGLASARDFERPPKNRSGAARIPVDLTGGLGFRMDTSLGGFSFSFSNVLGFIPTGGEP
jgi:outer membrane protein assembly factor BamA